MQRGGDGGDGGEDEGALTASAAVRIKKEMMAFRSAQHALMRFESLVHDRLDRWFVILRGPPDSSYEGGSFRVLVRFPDNYPMDPPSVQFIGEFFHPNVYRDGKVCLSTLQMSVPKDVRSEVDVARARGASNWTPALDVESVFISVVSLLADPNPNDPANLDAAKMLIEDRKAFDERVKMVVAVSKILCPDEGIAEQQLKRVAGCAGCTCPQCGEVCDRKAPCMFSCMHDDSDQEELFSFDEGDDAEDDGNEDE
jgi:ubiquitin-protein ligase